MIQESQLWGPATLLGPAEGRIPTEPHSLSVCEAPLVARDLDEDEEESSRFDLPSSPPDLRSSALMAHKDVAPNTKVESHGRLD